MAKAHPADPRPSAERRKPRPSESRKHAPPRRALRLPPVDAEKYPHLEANQALDRALHIHRAMAMGLTRAEAEAHADEHVGPRVRPAAPQRRKGARKVLGGTGTARPRRAGR